MVKAKRSKTAGILLHVLVSCLLASCLPAALLISLLAGFPAAALGQSVEELRFPDVRAPDDGHHRESFLQAARQIAGILDAPDVVLLSNFTRGRAH